MGVGSAACAALLHQRRAAGADILSQYVEVARERVTAALEHRLERRPIHRPVYQPDPNSKVARKPLKLDLPELPLEEAILIS